MGFSSGILQTPLTPQRGSGSRATQKRRRPKTWRSARRLWFFYKGRSPHRKTRHGQDLTASKIGVKIGKPCFWWFAGHEVLKKIYPFLWNMRASWGYVIFPEFVRQVFGSLFLGTACAVASRSLDHHGSSFVCRWRSRWLVSSPMFVVHIYIYIHWLVVWNIFYFP